MSWMFGNSKSGAQVGGRPPAAVEISPEGVLAAARHGGSGPTYAFVELPAGAVVPGIGEANLAAPETVAEAIRSALEEVSPRTRSVTLVVPDPSVRVFVLDFDAFPARAAEAVPVVRFRLRKTVPFDVEQAGIGYQVLTQSKAECKVLAAVLPGPILAEYEAAVRAAGYEPGAVLPSSLAALEAADSDEPALTANMSAAVLTTTIAAGNDLLLYRTLDLPVDAAERATEVQRGIAVAAAYYEDKVGTRPTELHYSGRESRMEFARWIGDPELRVVDLVERPMGLPMGRASVAGVAGALAGVR
ncbi:MAG: type IV pilus biogenesis protein PilM [Terracidiphilus sp.]